MSELLGVRALARAMGVSPAAVSKAYQDGRLTRLVTPEEGQRRKDTLLLKRFPAGSFRLVGANSPAGFRKVNIRIMCFDEVDGYAVEAGSEGNQIALGIKRTEWFWNRKIVAGSTPTGDVTSRIKPMFESGDRRRYHVPCPLCGYMHVLVFKNLKWPEDNPQDAYFLCPSCEGKITHDKKIWMVERGEWIAEKPFDGHASFHIWTAYSFSANASWGKIATEFVTANKQGPSFLKTFVNTTLGETWQDATDIPDWNSLYARREPYARGTVPAQARFVTAGVDVQKDRLEAEIVAWGPGLESWTLDYLVIEGSTANVDGPAWTELYQLLGRQFEGTNGVAFPITKMGIDAGYDTQTVINWCRKYHFGGGRIVPVKGVHSQAQIIKSPQPKDIRASGKRKRNGARLWPVGVSHIKKELYGWYRLPVPCESDPIPGTGYCHFGDFLDEHYFKMLTAEVLERVFQKTGFSVERWILPPHHRNEALDCRVYNRAMAYLCGVDTLVRDPVPGVVMPPAPAAKPRTLTLAPQKTPVAVVPSGTKGKRRRRRTSWL